MFEISDLRRETLHLRSVCPPGGGGYSDMFIHMLWLFFEVLNFEFQYFLFFFGGGGGGGVRKLNILGGMKILWIFFFFLGGGVITKLAILRGHFYAFRVFSEGQGTEW